MFHEYSITIVSRLVYYYVIFPVLYHIPIVYIYKYILSLLYYILALYHHYYHISLFIMSYTITIILSLLYTIIPPLFCLLYYFISRSLKEYL